MIFQILAIVGLALAIINGLVYQLQKETMSLKQKRIQAVLEFILFLGTCSAMLLQ